MFQRQTLGAWVTVLAVAGWLCAAPALAADEAGAPQDSSDSSAGTTSIFAPAAAAADSPAAPEGGGEMSADQTVRVGSYGQIDLHVKDLDLTRVLQLLSIQSQRNIVASRNVAGTVSADLYGVDFYEALDAVLQPNGFGYREKGNFIYVYTASEIKAIEEAERKLSHRVYRLNYLSADAASTFVTPLLSSAGSIALSTPAAPGIQPTSSDAGANSYAYGDLLIIRDYPENIEAIVEVLDELDVRPKQVLIEATILQAQMDEVNGFGVDFSILVDLNLSQFIRPLDVVDSLINGEVGGEGEGLQSSVGNTRSGESGFKFGVLQDDFSAFLRALDRVTDTTVIANPKLLVLNRQRADLLVGAKLGYLSTTATDTSTTQTVDFLEVGTQLSVRPFVSDDDFIRLELNPSISDGTTAAVDGVVIPNETTQEVTTNIMIRNGQTVVLGGLFKEDTETERSRVPGLGDMPVVGAAFNGFDDSTSRSEVIFLIKPTVLNDNVLYAAGDRAADNIELARLGAREGLLPWSRSRMVAGHVRDAMKQYQEGKKKWALWSANLALMLDPGCIEAMKIKERIAGTRTFWPARSILGESIDDVIDRQLRMGQADDADGEPQGQSADAAATESEGTGDSADDDQTEVSIAADPFQTEPATEDSAETEPDAQAATAEVAEEGFEGSGEIEFTSGEDASTASSAPARTTAEAETPEAETAEVETPAADETAATTNDDSAAEDAPGVSRTDNPAPATFVSNAPMATPEQTPTDRAATPARSDSAAPAPEPNAQAWAPGDDAGLIQGVSELRPIGDWRPFTGQSQAAVEEGAAFFEDDPLPASLD